MGDRQQKIAAGLDEAAQEAADMGYPSTAENLKEQARNYRAKTDQKPPEQPQEGS